MKSKRRKLIDENSSFKGLIDVRIPLWIDVFTIIFRFIPDITLAIFLSVSKRMYELVKERAVFHNQGERLVFTNKDEIPFKLYSKFYFSQIIIHGDLTVEGEKKSIIERQRFLSKFAIYSGVFDMRIFTGRDQRGELLFPRLKKVDIWSSSLEKCQFWEFAKAFPKRLTLFHDAPKHPWTRETLQRLVDNVKLDEVLIAPSNFEMLSMDDCKVFKDIDVRKVTAFEVLDAEYIAKLLACGIHNENIRETGFVYSDTGSSFGYETVDASQIDKNLGEAYRDGFRNLEVVWLVNYNEKKFFRDNKNHPIAQRFRLLSMKKSMKKIVLENYLSNFSKDQVEFLSKQCRSVGWNIKTKTTFKEDGEPCNTLILYKL